VYKIQIKKYYDAILEEINDKSYDYFFLIKGEVVPIYFIQKLKEMNPGIIMIYYNYDSFANNPYALDFLHFFDSKFTFDTEDVIKYKMKFRPLFFSDDYSNIETTVQDCKKEYDISFIGTAHSDRYLISETVGMQAEKFGLSHFTYYYSQGKIVYFYKKFFDKSFKKFSYKKLSFKSLSHDDIISIYKCTKSILDINHPGQKGLTMRTFETLGAGKKLITTNSEIQKYKFFDNKNIMVLDREKVELDQAFFDSEFQAVDTDYLHAMSLDGWIDDLFTDTDRGMSFWL